MEAHESQLEIATQQLGFCTLEPKKAIVTAKDALELEYVKNAGATEGQLQEFSNIVGMKLGDSFECMRSPMKVQTVLWNICLWFYNSQQSATNEYIQNLTFNIFVFMGRLIAGKPTGDEDAIAATVSLFLQLATMYDEAVSIETQKHINAVCEFFGEEEDTNVLLKKLAGKMAFVMQKFVPRSAESKEHVLKKVRRGHIRAFLYSLFLDTVRFSVYSDKKPRTEFEFKKIVQKVRASVKKAPALEQAFDTVNAPTFPELLVLIDRQVVQKIDANLFLHVELVDASDVVMAYKALLTVAQAAMKFHKSIKQFSDSTKDEAAASAAARTLEKGRATVRRGAASRVQVTPVDQ
eukprot:3527915-Rhodomonas_salina.1